MLNLSFKDKVKHSFLGLFSGDFYNELSLVLDRIQSPAKCLNDLKYVSIKSVVNVLDWLYLTVRFLLPLNQLILWIFIWVLIVYAFEWSWICVQKLDYLFYIFRSERPGRIIIFFTTFFIIFFGNDNGLFMCQLLNLVKPLDLVQIGIQIRVNDLVLLMSKQAPSIYLEVDLFYLEIFQTILRFYKHCNLLFKPIEVLLNFRLVYFDIVVQVRVLLFLFNWIHGH